MIKRILFCSIFLALLGSTLVGAESSKKSEPKLPAENGMLEQEKTESETPTVASSPQQNYEIPWSSLNGGGGLNQSSANYKMKGSVGQSGIGAAAGTNYEVGLGYWYGTKSCLAKPGDANASNTYTLGDAIAIVNYIFNKPGCSPQPTCWLSNLLCRGDWNRDGMVQLSDAIRGVNYIFDKPNGPWNALSVGVCCL